MLKKGFKFFRLENQSCNNIENIRNKVHNNLLNFQEDSKILRKTGSQINKPAIFEKIGTDFCLSRIHCLGNVYGSKSYVFNGCFTLLDLAIKRYVFDLLIQDKFIYLPSPSLISKSFIEKTGFLVHDVRNQIFSVISTFPHICLIGTSEISIAARLSHQNFALDKLPYKFFSNSRCFRAETTSNKNEHGIYRCNYFDKIEMFGLTRDSEDESEAMLNHFTQLQETIFSRLSLNFKVLEMGIGELGLSAHHKFDVEAWMPGRAQYGEISSASNCTNFQSQRLAISSLSDQAQQSEPIFLHTINGTACATPRLLIAFVETHYDESNQCIHIPDSLIPHLKKLCPTKRFRENKLYLNESTTILQHPVKSKI